jgi:hypothetical protein
LDGQLKHLKGAEENQVILDIIWACFMTASPSLRHSSALRTQVASWELKKSWGHAVQQCSKATSLLSSSM